MRRRSLLYSVLLTSTLFRHANAYDAADTIEAIPGNLPLLFTVPHDGGEFFGMSSTRTRGATVRDVGTRDLALRTAEFLERRTGRRPYVVIAKFTRKQLDANRSESEAMDSQELLPAYKAYHGQIATYVKELRRNYPKGALLVDVHGQSEEPNTTFRGTRAGLTTKRLIERFGHDALQGDKSVTGALASRGYNVSPASAGADLLEDQRYSGGFTVSSYGSHRPDGIDAIQLEFGRQHRANSRLAEDVALSVLGFMQAYELLDR